MEVPAGQTVGYRFKMTVPFKNPKVFIFVNGKSGGSCEIQFYSWNTDYSTTIAGTPLGTNTVEDATQTDYDVGVTTNTVLSAGDYLVTLTNTTDPSSEAQIRYYTRDVSGSEVTISETTYGYWYQSGVE